MAQAQRLGLNDRLHLDQIRCPPDLGEHGLLTAGLQGALQDEILDEMRDHTVLAFGGDDYQPFGPGFRSLLGHQLDARRIDHRQQLLGDGLGRREKTGAQTGRRHNCRAGEEDLLLTGHGDTLTPTRRTQLWPAGPGADKVKR